jgi:hypothetical protein
VEEFVKFWRGCPFEILERDGVGRDGGFGTGLERGAVEE